MGKNGQCPRGSENQLHKNQTEEPWLNSSLCEVAGHRLGLCGMYPGVHQVGPMRWCPTPGRSIWRVVSAATHHPVHVTWWGGEFECGEAPSFDLSREGSWLWGFNWSVCERERIGASIWGGAVGSPRRQNH